MDIFGMKETQTKINDAADAVKDLAKNANDQINASKKLAEETINEMRNQIGQAQTDAKRAAKVLTIFEGIKCVAALGCMIGIGYLCIKE